MNTKSVVRRHQLVSYFVLAYLITWGSILVLLASKGFQLKAIQPSEFPIIFLFMVLGPSLSSIILSILLEGRSGLRALRYHLLRWQVSLRWYAIALLTVPTIVLFILMLSTATISPEFAPQFRIEGLLFGLLAGALEELGWTGFATPRLLKKYPTLRAGLVLGVLWACWHIFADFTFNFTTMGSGWLLWILSFWIVPLIAYRILMTWVYSHTRSLLVAQLMHAGYTGWLYVLSPQTSFNQSLLWQTSFALSLWAVVFVFVASRRERQIKVAV